MRNWLPQNIPTFSLPELFAGAKKSATKFLPAPSAKVDLPQLPIPRTPFDRYRLQKLLRKMNLRSVFAKSVLEVGCGIGDLLLEITKYQPREIFGVERKQENINYARKAMKAAKVDVHFIFTHSYKSLHLPDKSFDYVFLMHEFDALPSDKLVEEIVKEISRLSRQWIVVVEETAEKFTKNGDKTLRTVLFYKELLLNQRLPPRKDGYQKKRDSENAPHQDRRENQDRKPYENRDRPHFQGKPRWQNNRAGGDRHHEHSKPQNPDSFEVGLKEDHRFHLRKVEYLDVAASRYIFTGRSNPWHWIRWIFSPLLWLLGFSSAVFRPPMKETELPDSGFAMKLQEKLLPLTASLDDVFTANGGITIMWFEREKLFRRG